MTDADHPDAASAEPRTERLQRWIAALASVLLHVLMALLLLSERPPVVTTPQGAASGGRVRVDFVGEPAQAEQTMPAPPAPSPARSKAATPPGKPVVLEKIDPRRLLIPEPVEPPQPEANPRPAPPAPAPARAAASSPASTAQRRPETWTGRPPGLVEENVTTDGDGSAPGPANDQGDHNDVHSAEPSMSVGGYQVVYDLLGEERLRGWIAQGMTEVSIPLPGTRYRMVCPAEVALRRGSSKCRLLDPNDPEMAAIGDARQVISVYSVYHRGERVWQGPGPYR